MLHLTWRQVGKWFLLKSIQELIHKILRKRPIFRVEIAVLRGEEVNAAIGLLGLIIG